MGEHMDQMEDISTAPRVYVQNPERKRLLER
jgi:hypothetical protein